MFKTQGVFVFNGSFLNIGNDLTVSMESKIYFVSVEFVFLTTSFTIYVFLSELGYAEEDGEIQ